MNSWFDNQFFVFDEYTCLFTLFKTLQTLDNKDQTVALKPHFTIKLVIICKDFRFILYHRRIINFQFAIL